jgi:predicted ATPase
MLTLLTRIDELVKNNSQFIISTHSPILMAYPNAEIYEIKDGKLQKTVWNNCMHVMITQYFLQNPQKMLKELGIENLQL